MMTLLQGFPSRGSLKNDGLIKGEFVGKGEAASKTLRQGGWCCPGMGVATIEIGEECFSPIFNIGEEFLTNASWKHP